MTDLVTVVVPAYQRAYCVTDAVDSVLAQTHERVECVVVDDGSTDGTAELVEQRFAGDDRVCTLREAHAGVSAARNAGIRRAHGGYATFLDSDDLMPPSRVARQLELLDDSGCDAVIGTYEVIGAPGVALPPWLPRTGSYWTSVLTPTRHLLAIGGFDEAMGAAEDLDLLVRLVAAGLRLHAADEVFTVHRYFGDNITAGVADPVPAMHDVVRRHLARRRGLGT